MPESYGKGKDPKKKKMKRKDCGRGSREKMWFCEKKIGLDIICGGVKSEWERKLPSLQISLQYDLITKKKIIIDFFFPNKIDDFIWNFIKVYIKNFNSNQYYFKLKFYIIHRTNSK